MYTSIVGVELNIIKNQSHLNILLDFLFSNGLLATEINILPRRENMIKKIACSFLLLVVFVAFSFDDASARKKSIIVGVSATYTGGFASVGKYVSDGEIDYLNWIANHGGIEYIDPASGKKEKVALEVMWEVNQYDVSKAITAYKRLRAKGANVITGFGSTPGEASAANASREKLPYLSWYSYASPAGYKPKPQYYWSLLPSIAESITPMIKWFVKEKWQGPGVPRVGIMSADLPSWRVLGKPGMMDQYVKSIGGKFAGIEFIPLLATDLSIPITRLVKDEKVDCLILIGTLSQTVVMAKDLQRLGIDKKKTVVICNASAWDESLFKSIPEAVTGLYGEVFTVSRDEDVPGMKKVKEVAKWAGRKPEHVVINYTNGFIGSIVLEAAIKRALEKKGYENVVKSGDAIRDELHNFKAVDVGGLAPAIEVRYPDMPYFVNYSRVVEAKDGKFKIAGKWTVIDRIKGALD
jgi:ABC-type branched-subunit amino acid transport system substrate-binding protein